MKWLFAALGLGLGLVVAAGAYAMWRMYQNRDAKFWVEFITPQGLRISLGQTVFIQSRLMYKPKFKTMSQAVPIPGTFNFSQPSPKVALSDATVVTDIASPIAQTMARGINPGTGNIHVQAIAEDGTTPPWVALEITVTAQ